MTTLKVRHTNNGNCLKCDLLFEAYAGFHTGLQAWFKNIQASVPDAHISEAGRGRLKQESYFEQGATRAHYGYSAHNYNCALDIFCMEEAWMTSYNKNWFDSVVGAAVENHNNTPKSEFLINWYGRKGATFYELPHCEVKGWKRHNFKLVELECATSLKISGNIASTVKSR